MDKRIIFAGTPDFAAVHLKALLEQGIRPVAVYTQPDRPSGRGHKLTPSAVKDLALKFKLDVKTPLNFKNENDILEFENLKADLCIVVAYGIILPDRILKAPRLGCINVHGSILPKYRGAAPIQRALFSGEKQTGVSIMKLVKKLDAGDVYFTDTLQIADDDTSGSLFEKLSCLGAKLLTSKLDAILNGSARGIPQDESLATYAKKITKDECPLDFNQDAEKLCFKIRALLPWPAATAELNGVRFKIFKAKPVPYDGKQAPGSIVMVDHRGILTACNNSALLIEKLQMPGKGPVSAADLARSHPLMFTLGKKFD